MNRASAAPPPRRPAVVRAWLARQRWRVHIVCRPPYAPNPNLTERLWWLPRKKVLRNTRCPTLADLPRCHPRLGRQPRTVEARNRTTRRFHLTGHTHAQIPAV